jgi:hypothetical protein
VDTFTVAFIPRVFIEMPSIVEQIGFVAIVEEIYYESDSTLIRCLSDKMFGKASCCFITDYGTNNSHENNF